MRDGRGQGEQWRSWLAGAAVTLTVAVAGCAGGAERPEDEWFAWQEDPLVLPAVPDTSSLLPVSIGRPGDPYQYFIDPGSLRVGRDGVTRYVVVLRSAQGAGNVFYEGIRCSGATSRVFAYGSGGGFRVLPDEGWKGLTRDGPNAYRFMLARGYLCTALSLPFDEKAALARLRMPNAPGIHEQGLGLFQ